MLISYLKYIYRRKTKFRTHSPFVFQLIINCFDVIIDNKKLIQFIDYRKKLFSDKTFINITDFGAGSKIFKTNQREVAKMAKISGMSLTKARLVMKLVHYFQPKNALELGTSLGIGTAAMKIAYADLKISTIEGCNNTAQIAQKYFELNNFEKIELSVGNFETILPKITENNTFDLIYFDGNHTEKSTLDYFNWTLNCIHNDTLFIFDDIHWSQGMENAWNKIIENQKVTISIDLYHLGLVFFRKESTKQHFIL